jgi:quercetin dioxygenase-like cupin family protein
MESTPASSHTLLLRVNDGTWESIAIGVSMKVLRSDKESGESSILLRFEAGAGFPVHSHPGGEEVYVLEGDMTLGQDELNAGDYLYTSPGGAHAAVSRNGCLLLVITPQGIEVLK